MNARPTMSPRSTYSLTFKEPIASGLANQITAFAKVYWCDFTNQDIRFSFSQNFTLTRDDYGITRIEDLSVKDMEKVRSLALIELTALFDQNNLVFNRRKPTKRKVKGNSSD
jgi:hypothetical protein